MPALYTYRGVPIVAPLTIKSNEPYFFSDTLSLRQERVSQAAQRWELSFNANFKGEEGEYFASLISAGNDIETMVMPQLLPSLKNTSAVETLLVTAFESADSDTVMVSSTEAGETIAAGSFITFDNHHKVYMVKSTHVTSLTGATLSIYPRLTEPVSSDTVVYHPNSEDKPMLDYYTTMETLRGVTYDDGIMVNPGLISIIEVL